MRRPITEKKGHFVFLKDLDFELNKRIQLCACVLYFIYIAAFVLLRALVHKSFNPTLPICTVYVLSVSCEQR